MSSSRLPRQIVVNFLIMLFVFLNFAPLIVTLSSSFRSPGNISSPFSLFSELSLESYGIAYQKMKYLLALMNSVIYTALSIFATIIVTSMAAYPLARLRNRFSNSLLLFFVAGLIVPAQLSIIPIYVVMRQFGMINTRLAPIVMFITSSISFSVFLYTGFIRNSVPFELEEAGLMDGAGTFRRFWIIVFPLVAPATVAVIISQGMFIWNDFFFPLLLIGTAARKPLPQVMLLFIGGRENPTQYNILFAACFLAVIPMLVIFAFLQRHFVSGLTIGSLKG
jgi:raffinose/stachyose/melibiose transport system permease protein